MRSGSQVTIDVPILLTWNPVSSRTNLVIVTVVTRCAVVRYVHSRTSGVAVSPSCTNDQGAYGAFFIFYPEETLMTMIRGTRFIVGKEAAQIRALETQFRSYLH